jgi:hypothetical protein
MPKPAHRDKRGVIITALALAAAAVPIVTAALGLIGALSPHSRLETQVTREEYRSQALEEYLRSRLESPQGWQDWVSTTVVEPAPPIAGQAEGGTPPEPAPALLDPPRPPNRFSGE